MTAAADTLAAAHDPLVAGRARRLPFTLAEVAVFVLVGTGLVLLALDGGGYDIVVRQRAATVLWWALALAALAGALPRTRPSRGGIVAIGALLAYGAWTAISLAWTSSDERTLTEIARVGAHLGVLVAVALVLGPATWRAAIAGATAAAAAITVAALIGRLHPGFLGTDYTSLAFGSSHRLEQPFGYWNAVGIWASMAALLCLAWSAHLRNAALRAIALAPLPATTAVSYLTYSRSAFVGLAAGAIVLVAVSANRWTVLAHALAAGLAGAIAIHVVRGQPAIVEGTSGVGSGKVVFAVVAGGVALALLAAATGLLRLDRVRLPRRWARPALAVGGVAVVAAIAVLSATVAPSAWDSFKTQGRDAATSSDPSARLSNLNGTRYQIWKVALDDFARHPMKGTGAGTWEFTWNRHATEGEFIRDAHSLFIENLTELGLPGLLLILTLIGGGICVLWRLRRTVADPGPVAAASAALACYVLAAGVDWMWESTAVTVLALALVGAAIAASGRSVSPPKLPWRFAFAAGAIVICLTQLPGLVSTSEVRRSQAAVGRGDLGAALAHANQAIDAQPWAVTALTQRALVEEQTGELRAARADLRAAVRREPLNWRTPLLLARVEARAGRERAALAAYRRARSLRPLGGIFKR